jgi:hypothetical protein
MLFGDSTSPKTFHRALRAKPAPMTSTSDKFMWTAGDLRPVGICNTCKHLRPVGCDAFPWGIPPQIRSGQVDHRYHVEGDNGIKYEPDTPFDLPNTVA